MMRLKKAEFNKLIKEIEGNKREKNISHHHQSMAYDILVENISPTKVGEKNNMSKQGAHKQAKRIYNKYIECYGKSKFPVAVKPVKTPKVKRTVDLNLQIQQTIIQVEMIENIKQYAKSNKLFLQDVYKSALLNFFDFVEATTTHKPSAFYTLPLIGKTVNLKVSEELKEQIKVLAKSEKVSERRICYTALVRFYNEYK